MELEIYKALLDKASVKVINIPLHAHARTWRFQHRD